MVLVVDDEALSSTSPSDVTALLSHPRITHANEAILAQTPRAIDGSPLVYAAQGEALIASAARVTHIGSADATTCCIVLVHNRRPRTALCCHLDTHQPHQFYSLRRQIDRLTATTTDADTDTGSGSGGTGTSGDVGNVDVYIAGAYDGGDNRYNWLAITQSLLSSLHSHRRSFALRLLCVGPVNTHTVTGVPLPILTSLFLSLDSGEVIGRADFPLSSRGPWIAARSMLASKLSPSLSTSVYDTDTDTFTVTPFDWPHYNHKALRFLSLADNDTLLSKCSTSPLAEPAWFCDDLRAKFALILQYGDGRQWWTGTENGEGSDSGSVVIDNSGGSGGIVRANVRWRRGSGSGVPNMWQAVDANSAAPFSTTG